MFEFNLAEAFANIVLDAIKENNGDVKFGPRWVNLDEKMNMTEVKVTVNFNLIKFVAVGQTLSIFVGDNGEKKVAVEKDDNAFDIAMKIIAALN